MATLFLYPIFLFNIVQMPYSEAYLDYIIVFNRLYLFAI